MDKALDGSQKRKKRKVLDKSRDLVRITHRVVLRSRDENGTKYSASQVTSTTPRQRIHQRK